MVHGAANSITHDAAMHGAGCFWQGMVQIHARHDLKCACMPMQMYVTKVSGIGEDRCVLHEAELHAQTSSLTLWLATSYSLFAC